MSSSDLFPAGGDVSRASSGAVSADDARRHAGDRRDAAANLFLATGHGTLGWTMAAGTARVMADLIAGASREIDLAGLTIDRYPNAYR